VIPENVENEKENGVFEENKIIEKEIIQEKTIEEYDKEISEAVKKEHPEIFEEVEKVEKTNEL